MSYQMSCAVVGVLLCPLTMYAGEPPAPFTISIEGVREVCVQGTSSADYWGPVLQNQGLELVVKDGFANVLICATQLKWGGARFQELIVSVRGQTPGGGEWADGYYLVGALNSKKSFAWVERRRNHAPYEHGDIVLEYRDGASRMEASLDDVPMVKMSRVGGDSPGQRQEVNFLGPIFLPGGLTSHSVFYAALEGVAILIPFQAGVDVMELGPSTDGVTRALVDSHFVPTDWIIKEDATHRKSDTVTW